MSTINHWGKWIDSDVPATGVLSLNSINWDCMPYDDLCLDCQEMIDDIENDDTLEEDEKEHELEMIECDSSHVKLIGDWLMDENGQYVPDESGEYAAILREDVIQIVWSRFTTRGNVCSPCYPGQIDLDSAGNYLAYTLPDDMLREED